MAGEVERAVDGEDAEDKAPRILTGIIAPVASRGLVVDNRWHSCFIVVHLL